LYLVGGGGCGAAGPPAPPSGATGGREAAAPLFQSLGNRCGNDVVIAPGVQPIRTYWMLKPCLCRKWYCEDCAPMLGKGLRRRLAERLKRFGKVFGITLTIDGSLFASPEEAWHYVMDKRVLSLFVKKLHKSGFLISRDYFWVVEWQEETQQAHWHLLLDAEFIPFGAIVEVWSGFRPKSAPALPQRVTADNYLELDRPAFGSVRFTLTKGATPWRAAGYATKYLIKVPEYGFPDWVLDYVGRIPRYGHSRGFFADGSTAAKSEQPREPSFDPNYLEREAKSLRERIADCKSKTNLFRVDVLKDGGEYFEDKPLFKQTLAVSYAEVCDVLGVEPGRSVRLTFAGYMKVWGLESHVSREPCGSRNVMEDDW
jgi:hypothetical protein